MILYRSFFLLFLSACIVAAEADITREPHLSVVPRTPDEVSRINAVTSLPTDFSEPQAFEENSGGATTVRRRQTREAFSQSSANLAFEDELTFKVGNGLFRKLWVSSPSSTLASDGLGPLFNARSCQRCHLKDGRGHPPAPGDGNAVSFLLRLSQPAQPTGTMADVADYLASAPDPTYGTQLQDAGLPAVPAEYQLGVAYSEVSIALSGGEVASLRQPTYTTRALSYGALHPDTQISPRVAPQMIGLGLLEAIPASDILAGADPMDNDGNGVSGRANVVWSTRWQQPMLGRFGLKAGQPTLVDQNAQAFAGDIGISSPLHPAPYGDCTEVQVACRSAPHGDGDDREFEIDGEILELVTFYSRNLAVPARGDVADPNVLRGKQVFHAVGCADCHRPSFVTHRLSDRVAQSFQLIWPYTDLLLHDMGAGLADGFHEGRATGREWRTPPLWGIGLTKAVSGHTQFLHDGRARNLLEAVLWHGGEAQAARDRVIELPPPERADLIRFLESL